MEKTKLTEEFLEELGFHLTRAYRIPRIGRFGVKCPRHGGKPFTVFIISKVLVSIKDDKDVMVDIRDLEYLEDLMECFKGIEGEDLMVALGRMNFGV